PRRLDETVAFLFREKHVPTIGQAVLTREVDPPLRHERYSPVQWENLLGVRCSDVDRVPYPGAFDYRDPDLAPLLAELDLRSGDRAFVAFTREGHAYILRPVFEDTHHDSVLRAREVEEEVFAGQLDLVERDFAGVEENVVREEVR